MDHLRNKTDKDIELRYGDKPYLFPAGEVVAFDDRPMANWMINHATRNTGDARAPVWAYDLDFDHAFAGIPAKTYRFHGDPPREVSMAEVYGQPAARVKPVEDSPEIVKARTRTAIQRCDPDMLVAAGKAHKIYRKGMEKAHLVEGLLNMGWCPPGVHPKNG